ncbi:hypothetical protein SPAN111604_01735 [Sphingomonas antarctica]|uniref:beta strand repeat-containing protein n=1 Tax=Sphingomonas antarctica TaxID=2040274 RepID=UPI0039EB6201
MAMTLPGRRTRLLTGCAMATALAGHAHAQSYPDRALQGSSTTVSGNVSISRSSTIDHITVSSAQAIINWNPETGYGQLPPGPINFLPTGRTASFESGYGGASFTVLNRVLPSDHTRPIVFNGSVTAPSNSAVWFYSPGGIIAGPTATFNVGNLVLTASDIAGAATGGNLFGNDNTLHFVAEAAGRQSKIDIQSGARINTLGSGSYLALVAPVVSMAGTVQTTGSVGYITGESVDVRINSGLFDINFLANGGTSASGNVLSHTGTTSSTNGEFTNNGIFLAAMPKNQAISMLLSGTVGYQPAASASMENGVVVLSAGINLINGNAQINYTEPKLASILVTGGNVTSSFRAAATDTITIKPGTAQSTNFSDNVLLQGPNLLVDANAASVGIGGFLTLDATRPLLGGTARLSASNGGSIDAGNDITLGADGVSQVQPSIGENTQGGTVSITIDNGRISTPNTLSLSASGFGGRGDDQGGAGLGGLTTINVKNTVANDGLHADNIYANAEGTAGETGYGENAAGGSGTGGTVRIDNDAGTIESFGLFISARANGADGRGLGSGGAATGGTIQLNFLNSTTAIGAMTASTGAAAGSNYDQIGGVGGNGGLATGGNVSLLLDNATLTVDNNFNADADTSGGFSYTGDGGIATGGVIAFTLGNGSAFNSDLALSAQARGGSSNLNYDADGDHIAEAFGHGGAATSGSITLGVSASSIIAPSYVDLNTNAVGGGGAIGGNALGGSIVVDFPSGLIDPSVAGYFQARANAVAGSTDLGNFGAVVDQARSGDATGGSVTLDMGTAATSATLTFSSVTLSATGRTDPEKGGDVGAQGNIRGGTVTATLFNSTINAGSGLLLDTSAIGGSGASNFNDVTRAGGNAFGGTASLGTSNSTINSSSISVLATGSGGSGRDYQPGESGGDSLAARGGSGTGGMALINATGGSLGGEIQIDASGVGGFGGSGQTADGAAGGSAQGGTAHASFDFTQLNGSLLVYGTATGGGGGSSLYCSYNCGTSLVSGAGDGGSATAGTATLDLFADNSTINTITLGSTATGGAGGSVDASSIGNAETDRRGGNGGNATGAAAVLNISGAESSFGDIAVASYAVGGGGGSGQTGGLGGNATAGALTMQVGASTIAPSTLSLDSSAIGGNAADSALASGVAGGTALAGAMDVRLSGAASVLTLPSDGASFNAQALGGAGSDSFVGRGNGGAGGAATAGILNISVGQGSLDGSNSSAVSFYLRALGGDGRSGAPGGYTGATGGNGGNGGGATGGQLVFTASDRGFITLPQFSLDLSTAGGVGGSGGMGGTGVTGVTGADGGTGQDGQMGGTGGTGGTGGSGARGGSATGGRFAVNSLSGAVVALGDLNVDLFAAAGYSGSGGEGGYGGMGGPGGMGGLGLDNGNGTFVNPGTGGMGGSGGSGGDGGIGGDGANAIGGEFALDAHGGSITTGNLSAFATAVSRTGGQFGYAGGGGQGGNGGEGGYGAQENIGPSGNQGFYGSSGNFGSDGAYGQTQGGLISITARSDETGGGTLSTGYTILYSAGSISGGEILVEDGPGEIRIGAADANSHLTFGGLEAHAGDMHDRGYGGLISISGTNASLDLGDTFLISSGSIDLALSDNASILGGASFNAQANEDITISHDFLPDGLDTLNANTITLKSRSYIDTGSARLGAVDLIDIAATNDVTLGSAHVSGGSTYADSNGPHGAEIRAAGGGDPFNEFFPPQYGNLTVLGTLDATGSITLTASNDVSIYSGGNLRADNRVGLFADGDVTIGSGVNVFAGRTPLAENGYGQFDPFNQNGMLTIEAGSNPRNFGLSPGDISSVVIGGNLDANNGSISIAGAAIDATDSTASAQYIRADIFNATNGGSDDFGRLRTGCTEGLICLGGLNAGSTVQIGVRGAPLAASLTGPLSVSNLTINALGDIHFGDGSNALTIEGTDYFHVTSTNGNIVLDGPVTLQGDNDFSLIAGGALFGPQGSVLATYDLVLGAPGGVTLANLVIGGQFIPAGESFSTFNVSDRLRLGSGDLILSTTNAINFGQIEVNDGVSISLTSTGSSVSVGSVGNVPFGTPGSITVNAAGAVTLTHAETTGNLLVNGASFMTGLHSIITGGDIDINVAGLADLGNSSAGGHADVTGQTIQFVSLTTGDFTQLTATGGGISATSINSGATTTLSGDAGIGVGTLVSTGAVALSAPNGGVQVYTQLDAPSVTASGQSIALSSNKAILAPTLNATAGNIDITAASFSGTSATATGAVAITAPGGVTLSTLSAGAASMLNAANGAVLVSSNITSPGLNVIGRSVTLRSTGSLNGLSGQATAGVFDAQAGGAISGSAISASTNAILVAPGGITLTGLTTGGTASLSATGGNINVTGVASNGLTATARDIFLRGPGALTVTNLVSSVGGIDVQTGGNMVVSAANAKSALTLGSTGGSLGFTTLVAGSNAALSAATTITGGTLSANAATLNGLNGVTLTGLSTTGTAAILATNGLISATNVNAGNVTATARGITLTSPTVLSASQLSATAGDIDVRGAQLALGTADATGTFNARAVQGGITFSTAQAGGNATLIAASTIAGTTLTSGGNSSVTAPGGITIATATSTGTSNFSATGGAIDIGINAAASALTATAQSVRLRATGALNITNAQATAGALDILSAGNLTIGTGSATTSLAAASTGGILGFGTLTSGGATTLTAGGTINGTQLISTGNAAITGTNGVAISTVAGQAQVALNAASGAINVSNNLTATSLSADGRSVFLRATGPLTASLLRATAGDVDVAAGTLTAATVQASGLVTLATSNGALGFTTLNAGGNATLNSGAGLSGNSLTAANATLTAPGAINVATISTGAANITSLNGNVTVGTDLRASSGTIAGQAVTLKSLGAVTLTGVQATVGAANVSTTGNLAIGTASANTALTLASTGGSLGFSTASAGSDATLSAATTITGGTLVAGGNATLTAPGGITLTGLNVSGTSQLSAPNGLIQVSGLVGSNVTANASAIRLSGTGAFAANNLSATGGLLDLNFGGGITLGTASAATTLNVVSGGTLGFTTLTSGGNATLGATTISGGMLTAGGSAGLTAMNGISLTGLSTSGTASLAASNGAVLVTGLAANDVIATGRSISLTSAGALVASSLTATASDVTLSGTRLALGTATASGKIRGTATAADISIGALSSDGDTQLSAATIIAGGTVNVGGNATLTAPNGITLSGLNVTGTGQLSAANGLVDVSGLVGSNVSVTASAIKLGGAGTFSASSLNATGGLLDLNFGGDITLGTANAATTLSILSGGAVGFTTLSSGGSTTLTGTTVTGGMLNSGGAAIVDGSTGVTLTGITVAGIGTLSAANGTIDATGVGTGNYSAIARSVRLRATGPLAVTSVVATAGSIDVASAGNLTLGTASATGAATLSSTNGDLTVASLAGGTTILSAAAGAIDASGVAVESLDASARSVKLRGTAGLTAGILAATAGMLDVRVGSLTATNVSGSAGSVLTADTGNMSLTNLSGGAAMLSAINGALTVGNDTASDTVATGRSIALTAPGTLNASNLAATAGALTLRGTSLALGTGSASGTLDARSSSGALGFTNLASGGDATLVSATSATGTTLSSGGAISVTAPGGIDIANLRAVGAAALNSNGAVRISNDLASSSLTASGSSLYLRSLGSFNAASLISTSGAIDIGTAGALGFTTINSAGATTIAAGTTVTGTTLVSGGATTITAPSGITLGTLRSTGTATLNAPSSAVRVNTEVTTGNLIVNAGSIFLRTPGALTLNQIQSSTGDVDIASAGNLSITSATAAGALILASSGGNVTVGSIGGQSNPTAATLTAAGSITLGNATASNAINLSAGTLATLNGTMTAPTIGIRSADIAIGGTARIGSVTGTSQLTFTSIAGSSVIGGSSTGTGYRLSESELLRAFANNITIATATNGQGSDAIDPNATPSMTLDTLTLSAAGQGQQATGNLGNAGTLRFQTSGTMRVTGAVKLASANSGNRLELSGGPAIEIRPGGSAAVVNGTDLAGTLVLTAADIIASDATTLTSLANAADAKAQGNLLATNPGATDDTGFFAANAVNISIGHGLFVQNTGGAPALGTNMADARRGFTVGSGGLNIVSNAGTPVTVAINGRQVSTAATGGFITGTALIPLVGIGSANVPTALVAGSSINGCAISSGGNCNAIPDLIEPGSVARDTIEASDLLDDALEAATNAINTPDVLVELPGFNSLIGQPLIEDPVTGSGNDDLLADKDGKECDPATETCTKP